MTLNPFTSYKYVKSKQQVKDSIGPLKGQNGEVTSDSKFKAEELNAFFASSFTQENTENISSSKRLNSKEILKKNLQTLISLQN